MRCLAPLPDLCTFGACPAQGSPTLLLATSQRQQQHQPRKQHLMLDTQCSAPITQHPAPNAEQTTTNEIHTHSYCERLAPYKRPVGAAAQVKHLNLVIGLFRLSFDRARRSSICCIPYLHRAALLCSHSLSRCQSRSCLCMLFFVYTLLFFVGLPCGSTRVLRTPPCWSNCKRGTSGRSALCSKRLTQKESKQNSTLDY